MQTNIEDFFKSRKRRAVDELPAGPSKYVARKLFDCDTHVERVQTPPPEDERKESTTEETSERPAGPSTPVQSPSTQESLKQRLNLGEFEKKIRRSKKYTDLKRKLKIFNATKERLHEDQESPRKREHLKPRRLFWTSPGPSAAKDLPYVSPKKLLDEGPKQLTPVKTSFEKYNHLLASGKEPLILPHKYLVLKEIFRSVDIITKIRNDRKEVVTFVKLQKDVQKMLSRNFTETHLGKVRAIYPEAYEFTRERMKVAFSNEEKYELIIKRITQMVRKDDESEEELSNSERLKVFHNRLLEVTKNHHQEFLSKLHPPIVLDKNKITLWHAEFELDNVPDIDPIPMPPVPTTQQYMSAKTILEKTHEMIRGNKRMERAVAALEKEEEKKSTSQPSTPQSCSRSSLDVLPAFQKSFKGIPKSILEKVRAKQAAKMAETLTQTPAEAKEAVMLSRLPELARIMRNVFVDEKKGILPVEVVMLKVGFSYKEKLGQNELMQHIQLISKHVPGWLNLCTVRNVPYVRLSKDADMTRVLGKLQKLANP